MKRGRPEWVYRCRMRWAKGKLTSSYKVCKFIRVSIKMYRYSHPPWMIEIIVIPLIVPSISSASDGSPWTSWKETHNCTVIKRFQINNRKRIYSLWIQCEISSSILQLWLGNYYYLFEFKCIHRVTIQCRSLSFCISKIP